MTCVDLPPNFWQIWNEILNKKEDGFKMKAILMILTSRISCKNNDVVGMDRL